MAKKKKGGPKYYAVAVGRIPGVYYTWPECQAQTSGYSGAVFKSFETMQEAQTFMRLNNNASSSTSTSSSFALPSPSAKMAQEPTNRGAKRPRLEDLLGTTNLLQHDKPSLFPASTATTTISSSKQNNNHQIRITIHFDGGSRGNPGVAGAGAHVIVVEEGIDAKSNTREYHVRKYCGEHATNNYAEYHGLIAGLEVAKSCIANLCKISSEETTNLPSIINLEVYGDSNLIIQQMRGIWKCTHANIRPLFHQCNSLIREMNECIAVATNKGIAVRVGRNGGPSPSGGECKFVVTFEHIRRHLNGVADALANEAMDARRSWTSIVTNTGDTSTQASGVGKSSDEMKPPIPSTRRSDVNDGTTKGGAVAASSSKSQVINVDDNDSDGNESHYSC